MKQATRAVAEWQAENAQPIPNDPSNPDRALDGLTSIPEDLLRGISKGIVNPEDTKDLADAVVKEDLGDTLKTAGKVTALTLLPTGKLKRYGGAKPKYHVNDAHVPGRGLHRNKTLLPPDAEDVFQNAVPNDPTKPTAWFGRNADGQIYRFSIGGDGTAHFRGIDGVGDGVRNLTDYAIGRLDEL